ncbi:MAG: glycogen debranching enzyme family protein [Bacteroidales bacterium]|nr:glycogen debranching enzyme family protein [Bacteroidales bacterium]
MNYLDFSKEEVTNLSSSLKKEYIRANKTGTYSSSTIINCNTRRYHGLLVCPLSKVGEGNYVLLSSLDETVIQRDASFNLGIHKFTNEFNPTGHKYIISFSIDPLPCIIYRVGGVILKRELLLLEKEERIIIKYTLLEANSPTTLKLKPFLAFRSSHDLTCSNLQANRRYEEIENGIKLSMYPNYPELHMQISKKNEFVSVPDWYMNYEYEKDKEKGGLYHEDLYNPGYFEFAIKKGEEIYFSAGIKLVKSNTLKKTYDTDLNARESINNYFECLVNSAKQFIYKNNNETRVIASFPGYGNWGRDSIIALPGLTISIGDFATCKEILDTYSKEIKGLVYTNKGNIDTANVDSIDTVLWYIRAIQIYADYAEKGEIIENYWKKIEEILKAFKSNQYRDIVELKETGMLYLPQENLALTWMDAKIDGQPIVKRWGYVVEINALWYNAICFAIELAQLNKNTKFIKEWQPIAENIKTSFECTFWEDSHKYLADFNTGTIKNLSIRPNQLFAASLKYSPLSEKQRMYVLNKIQNVLLTPRGIRSLSPEDPSYHGECSGSKTDRAIAFHQGSVWPWLLAPFAEAYLELNQQSGYTFVKRLYENLEEEMFNHGLGTISEIFDGNPPHAPRGEISQAWNVAALLRIKRLLEKFEKSI